MEMRKFTSLVLAAAMGAGMFIREAAGNMVVDLLAEEDDAIVEQTGIDVVASLSTRRLLDDVRNQRIVDLCTH